MSKINIYKTEWLNMVFEGRNKKYGAYQLRSENTKTTVKALFSALFLIGGAIGIPVIINHFTPKTKVADTTHVIPDVITLVDLTPIKPEEKPTKPENTFADSKPLTNEKVIKYVTMVAAKKEKATNEVPTIKELESGQLGQVNQEGTNTTNNTSDTTPKANENGTGNGSGNNIEVPATLEVQPNYPGGIGKFILEVSAKFKTPEMETDAKTLKVLVNFVVEKDGSLSNITVTRDPGYNLGKEATRVLNSMKTKWSPGYKNGLPVRTSFNLPIVVHVD